MQYQQASLSKRGQKEETRGKSNDSCRSEISLVSHMYMGWCDLISGEQSTPVPLSHRQLDEWRRDDERFNPEAWNCSSKASPGPVVVTVIIRAS